MDTARSVGRVSRTWAERHGLNAARVVEPAHVRSTIETVRLLPSHLDAEAEAKKLEQAEIEDTVGLRACLVRLRVRMATTVTSSNMR